MITTTSDYKKKIRKNRIFYCSANVQLADGTSFDVDNTDIMASGWGFSEGVSDTDSFSIGAAIIGSFDLRLRNDDGHLDTYDFEGAVVQPQIGLRITDETIEKLKRGVYTAELGTTKGTAIHLSCLDNMSKFECLYSEIETVYPANLKTIVLDMCIAKGVTLATQDFTNAEYVVQERPEDEDMTCLAMLSYVAQISGNFAKCNTDGALELRWYDNVFDGVRVIDGDHFDKEVVDTVDGSTFDSPPENTLDSGTFEEMTRYHHFYALSEMNVCTDDVVITGIRVVDTGKNEFLFGSEGYVLSIENNPLILDGQAEKVATFLGQKIVGMSFRPLSCSTLCDPSVEAGDPAYVTDRKGNSYPCYVTNLSFSISNYMKVSCDAETPSRNRSRQYSAETKTIVAARKEAQKVVDKYDEYVKQVTSLISQGTGMYITNVKQEDGSVIAYMHDKPTMEESSYTCYHTSQGIVASLDGGTTWAIDKNGNALFNTISTNGILAKWIKAGTIEAEIIAKNLKMQGGSINIETNSELESIIKLLTKTVVHQITAGQDTITNGQGQQTSQQGHAFVYLEEVDGVFKSVSSFGKDLRLGGDLSVNGKVALMNLSSQDTMITIDGVGYKGNWVWASFQGTDGNYYMLPAYQY